MNDIVSVRGEVQQPVNIKYDKDNTDIGYYVNSAGGYGERPWRSRVNVKYLSGRIKTRKTFYFPLLSKSKTRLYCYRST